MTQLFRALQRLQRLGVLDRTGLLNIKRLLIVGKLVFQLIHFQLSGFGARFVLFLHLGGFGHHFILFFEANLQLIEIGFVTLNFFLLTQGGLHQIQVIAGRLIIGFQVAFCTVLFAQFARHLNVLILLCHQLFTRGEQLAAIFKRLIQMNATLIRVAHIIRRHVVGRFADQVLEQVAVRLGDANGFQRHAVFTQRGFHILECFTHAAVFRQQVVAQRAGDSAGNTAIQRGFNQAIVFATVRGAAQTTRNNAQIEHQGVVIGNRVELLELNPFDLLKLLFQLLEREDTRLAVIQRFRQHCGWLNGGR
ncbi:hypothetical protein D3C78_925440 [compost metagenome]